MKTLLSCRNIFSEVKRNKKITFIQENWKHKHPNKTSTAFLHWPEIPCGGYRWGCSVPHTQSVPRCLLVTQQLTSSFAEAVTSKDAWQYGTVNECSFLSGLLGAQAPAAGRWCRLPACTDLAVHRHWRTPPLCVLPPTASFPLAPSYHFRSTAQINKIPKPQKCGGRSFDAEQLQRAKQRRGRQPECSPGCSGVSHDLRILLCCCWTMRSSRSCLPPVGRYLHSSKENRAELHFWTHLQCNHQHCQIHCHVNSSSAFKPGRPCSPTNQLHSSPCPRMYHVTKYGQWETGGHLSTVFFLLLLDNATPATHYCFTQSFETCTTPAHTHVCAQHAFWKGRW